ncbi:MAG: hypothetical protein M8467_17905 [Anaerolineae bacterium]|nr:hypothetical protein [Anaerolineae bacterium]
MSSTDAERTLPDQTMQFFARVFKITTAEFVQAGETPASDQEMSAVVSLQNQPEFWADAPWRLEMDRQSLPVSFHIRDANVTLTERGPWRLDALYVEQRAPDDIWYKLAAFLPTDLPGLDEQGLIQSEFWVFGTRLPIQDLLPEDPSSGGRGRRVHLRVRFEGSFAPHHKPSPVEIHLETFLAQHPLPGGRAAHRTGSRHWFYGDTHYHSAYTNDIKEFGGAIAEARKAGQAIGLDWLIVTDHSCDLDEVDDGAGSMRRWDRLSGVVSSPLLSDDGFRLILGEEITLLGEAGYPLHMLAFGSMDDMVQGAFLPAGATNFPAELARIAIEKILQASEGYPDDIPQRLFGQMHTLDEVLTLLPQGTLVFAAHPYDVAQVPPARWGKGDLTHPRLTGYEFWNGRIRVKGRHTYNPFDRLAWHDAARLQEADAARVAKLKKQARERWDPQLQRGVREWKPEDQRPAWRPVFIGGSDAHCDFNYHVGWAWDYRRFEVDDNALGRVRTAIHLPDHANQEVPGVDEILSAIERGACVVTDGPILELRLEHSGDQAGLGELLTVSGGGNLELRLLAHTTPEFGPVQEIEVVTYFPRTKGTRPVRTVVPVGAVVPVDLDGPQGYVRAEAQTTGPNGERFCCFTNPIWVRIADGQKRRMRLRFP